MTGDLGSDADGTRARPSARSTARPEFLPHDEGSPAPADPSGGAVPPPDPVPSRRYGAVWDLAMIAAAATMLVSAFLPWARAEVVVDLFGRSLSRDAGSVAGIDADDLVVAVPALAVVAIVLACWDLLGRDSRIGGLAAVPAVLALLACGVFVLRLGDVRDDLPGGVPGGGLDVGYQISVRYGWYLAVAASLLLIGCSLARPISDRMLAPRPGPAYGDRPHAWNQGEYGQHREYGEYAVWPQPQERPASGDETPEEPSGRSWPRPD
ncbi:MULTISPECIES: hypothetical protein [Actinomadura]|uniref:Uncharacterized protein n=1 Tax=Actinomadura litoris TaxID=2678616 RepID=A0A7K1L6X0_9ACTN|nr:MULTISPECIES: hypothetical protein [Actinomadura]MBT2209467.1 hypothetical protein [Actinomadura sp. NEAU-AAG7]MUN40158.1 hypothetical protein [Actinomadura litoris]